MPVPITDETAEDLEASPGTLAQFFRIELADGTTFGFTNYWKNVTDPEDSVVYKGADGLGPSAVQNSRKLSEVNNQTGKLFFDDERLTAEMAESGRLDGAKFTHFIGNYTDLGRGKLVKNSGYLDNIRSASLAIDADFVGAEKVFSTEFLDVTGPTCRYELGDEDCGVDLDGNDANGRPITVAGVALTAVADGSSVVQDPRRTFTASSLASLPENHFRNGALHFTSGDNAPLGWFPIEKFEAGEIQLAFRLPFAASVGDTFTIRAGCDKQLKGDCKNRYNNVVNFGGEPAIPQEKIYQDEDE